MSVLESLWGLFTVLFFLVLLSYYVLFFIRQRKADYHRKFSSVTVIVPARNEDEYIKACIESIQRARFDGEKQIIVVDDASKDKTAAIVKRCTDVMLLRNKRHMGKSYGINSALKHASGDLTAIVDGDSTIREDALAQLAMEVARKGHIGATGVVRAANRFRFLNVWVHLELLYSSLIRALFAKVNANVVTPGALSMYRTQQLRELGGFSTEGFSEDMDIAIRMIRNGHRLGYSEDAISDTNMPPDWKGFLRQRTRIARGLINILKRHMRLNRTVIDLYTLPLFLFNYLQAVIMGTITIYQIVSGYITYFAGQGVWLSLEVAKFFFEWFSIVGFAKWSYAVLLGSEPLTAVNVIGVSATLLTYPLYFVAILKYDRKLDIWHVLPLFFMFPYWLLLMAIYTICLPEVFRTEQYNRWKKNE